VLGGIRHDFRNSSALGFKKYLLSIEIKNPLSEIGKQNNSRIEERFSGKPELICQLVPGFDPGLLI